MPTSVGLIGAGTMGVGIAYVFAAAGCEVVVCEPNSSRIDRLRKVVAEQAESGLARGKMDAAQASTIQNRVQTCSAVQELPAELDLLVESVPERLELKHEVLAEAELRSPRILASNTSALSIVELSRGLSAPERFLGMHFFNPVWSFRLVEIIRGAESTENTIAGARELVAQIGKESLLVRDSPGFATSRLDVSTALEAMRMLEEGVASADDIDKGIVLAYRHPIGPLRLSDIVGLDVRLDIANHLCKVLAD
ncbi:MAG TPA: 3-hydroxyacyl-CoA dehydrogenase NAD-binding domain-containing protein, partial [Gemmatimonadaceae bacterium]